MFEESREEKAFEFYRAGKMWYAGIIFGFVYNLLLTKSITMMVKGRLASPNKICNE